jgi:hypothetical protein
MRTISEQKQSEKRNISAARAVNILKGNNIKISEKDAEKVLDLLYFLANLIVNQNFKK